MTYITRSNLIVGEISRLKRASQENTTYELTFFGTTLDCETMNRSMESTILQLEIRLPDPAHQEMSWRIQHPEPNCVLKNNEGLGLFTGDASIVYRVAHHQDTPQYWPCLDKSRWMPDTSDSVPINFPGSGIHVIVPVTETVCRPRLVEYHVTISDAGGAQQISYVIKNEGSLPAYTALFDDFKGSFEQWTQLADAVVIYQDFAWNLNQSGTSFEGSLFEFPSMSNDTKPYTTESGTVVETCVLEAEPRGDALALTAAT